MNTVAVLSGLYLLLACSFWSAEGRRLGHIHKRFTIIPTYLTTTHASCFFEGQIHAPGTSIGLGFNAITGNMCHRAFCQDGGHLIVDQNCHEGPPPTQTTIPITTVTILPGHNMCFHNGQYYKVGEEIEKGYDPASNWCYGTICGDNGQLMYYDNFNCHTTIPMTYPTTIPACFYEGQILAPGTSSGLGFNVHNGNMCHRAFCQDGGHLMVDQNCREGHLPTQTTIPTLPGYVMCFYNGQYYQVGEEIVKGYNSDSNWCYGTICGDSGELLHYDDFNCHTTIPPTTIPASPIVG